MRRTWLRWVIPLLWLGDPGATLEAREPSILVHCPRSSVDQWGFWVDLAYLRELRANGLAVDYTDRHEDFTWERVRRYDALVIYTIPLERGAYYDNSPDRPPYRDSFIDIVERFLEAGGGVLLMARALNADETFLPLLERWAARIPYERIEESNPENLAPLPRMRGIEHLWFTDAVEKTPVSRDVEQVWLPITAHLTAAETMPIVVSDAWQVVLRGTETSYTVPIDPSVARMLPPPDAVRRPGGVRAPTVFAIREYKAGRIAFCAMWPQYSIGQGTQWLYDRRVLSRGLAGRPSHFGRLLQNTLHWLAARAASSRPQPPRVDPQRLIDPGRRRAARELVIRRSLDRVTDPRSVLAAARARGRLYRGLLGARTGAGGGSGTVSQYAAAARAGGLDFVVFLEEAGALDGPRLERLVAECRQHSSADLRLFPGYSLETNTDNRMFLFGPDVELPPPDLLVEGRFNLQYRDPRSGDYVYRPLVIDWLHYRAVARGGVNVGYYGFADRPFAQRMPDLRFYSIVGLRYYRDGELLEDNLDDYLTTAAGTIPPIPAAVHLVSSPAQLLRAAEGNLGLTYAQATSIDALWGVLQYANQYAEPNVFTSDGPLIEAWPDTVEYYTYAAEDFVAPAARMPSPIAVRSAVGLDEVRIYDGERLFRRFRCDGAETFEVVLDLAASVQRTLVLVATDVRGGRAVSYARRCWKGGGLTAVFCGDRVNHCSGDPLLAKGPGLVPVALTPVVPVGESWDGGPRGERPLMRLVGATRPRLESDGGIEGERGLANLPRLEFADEGAVRVHARLDRLFAPQVPVVNPWQTYGPLAGQTWLFAAEVSLTALERPSIGPHPTLYAGKPRRTGAALTVFASDVTFRRDQHLESLQLFHQNWYAGPFPVTLVHGRGVNVLETIVWDETSRGGDGPTLREGDWLGCFGPEPTNLSVHLNRGAPLRLRLRGGPNLSVAFHAALAERHVHRGDQLHFELLSVVDPIDAEQRDLERVLRIVRQLEHPSGLRVLRGRPRGTLAVERGLLDLTVDDHTASVRARRPRRPVDVPLALRVGGLNRNWTAGVWLKQGYTLGHYDHGRVRFREAGLDASGRAWVPLFTDRAPLTEVVVGHPVTCDHRALLVQVTQRDGLGRASSWHVSINNPTERDVRTTLRAPMGLPGLALDGKKIVVPAGAHVVVQ